MMNQWRTVEGKPTIRLVQSAPKGAKEGAILLRTINNGK